MQDSEITEEIRQLKLKIKLLREKCKHKKAKFIKKIKSYNVYFCPVCEKLFKRKS